MNDQKKEKPSTKEFPVLLRGRVVLHSDSVAYPLAGLRVTCEGAKAEPTFTDGLGGFVLRGKAADRKLILHVWDGETLLVREGFVPQADTEVAFMPPLLVPQNELRPGPEFATTPADGLEPGLTIAARASFQHAIAALLGKKLLTLRQTGTLRAALDDLRGLQGHAERVLRDPGYGEKWLNLIGREWPWDMQFKPMPSPIGIDRCVIQFHRPAAPLLAAWVGRTEQPPFAQAISAYLRRAEPLTRTLRAIENWEGGLIGLDDVAVVARWAAEMTVPEAVGDSLIKAFANGPWPLPPGPVPIPAPPPIPTRPPIGVLLDPCNLQWLECALTLGSASTPPTISMPPPRRASVKPKALCSGATTGTVRLTLGGLFVPQPVNWSFAVAGRVASNLAWSPRECSGDITGPLPPGCLQVFWVPENGAFPDPLSPCESFFGPSPWRAPISHAGSLSVVGAPEIKFFTAGLQGQPASPGPQMTFDACSGVELRWEVDPHVCDSALAHLRLLADAALLRSGLPLQGAELVYSDRDVSYRLEVDNTDGSDVCATASSATLLVAREKRVRVSGPNDVPAGGSETFTVSISCPAPSGGVVVTLSSTPATALTAPAVMIPAGRTSGRATVTAANACGTATLHATAPGHMPGSAPLRILASPSITRVSGAGGLQACTTRTGVTVVVRCVTDRATVRLRGSNGMALPATVTNRQRSGTDPFAGPVTLTVTLPEASAGSYTLEVEDQGRVTVAPTQIVVAAAPRIVRAPPSISPSWTCPDVTVQIDVQVEGADSAEATLASNNRSAIKTRPTSQSSCNRWTAQFSFRVQGNDTVSVVAIAGLVKSAPSSVSIRPSFPDHVVPAIRFYGTMKRTLKIWQRNSTGQFVDTGATVTQGIETTFPLTRCEMPELRLTTKDANDNHVIHEWPSYSGFTGHPDAPPMAQPDEV